MQAVFDWVTKSGPSVLDKEEEVLNACKGARVGPQAMQAIRMAFANLRALTKVAQETCKMPVASVWQQLTMAIRQMFASLAGGTQCIGQFLMRQGQNFAAGAAAAWAFFRAAAGIAVAGILDAIEAAVAFLGGWPVVLGAITLIALGLTLNWIWKKNRPVYRADDDPLIKRLNSSTPQYTIPAFPAGRLG